MPVQHSESDEPRKKLITISIPVRNEEKNIDPLIVRLRKIADNNNHYRFEFLFTDNASHDRTFELLAAEARTDTRIRVIRFTRNFGFQVSILTNYLDARGNAVVQIDADMQDPPEMIPDFLAQWERGYKVVYGIRRTRQENLPLRTTRRIFYRVLQKLSAVDVPADAGDFRLIDRVIVEHLRNCRDRSPYLRGMIAELGYPQVGLPYDRSARVAGKSNFGFLSLTRLALDGICSQSTKPLEAITLFGFVLSGVSLLGALFYLVIYFVAEIRSPGFTTLVILVALSIGINSAFIGLLGEYIGRIFKNTREMPLPVISDRIEPLPSGSVEVGQAGLVPSTE